MIPASRHVVAIQAPNNRNQRPLKHPEPATFFSPVNSTGTSSRPNGNRENPARRKQAKPSGIPMTVRQHSSPPIKNSSPRIQPVSTNQMTFPIRLTIFIVHPICLVVYVQCSDRPMDAFVLTGVHAFLGICCPWRMSQGVRPVFLRMKVEKWRCARLTFSCAQSGSSRTTQRA